MLAPGLPLTPADSARAVAQVYTISLAAVVPLVLALVAGLLVRRRPAGTRALVWRGAVVALLSVPVGHLLPVHWTAWVVPGALASPLVALGRLQVSTDGLLSPGILAHGAHGAHTGGWPLVDALLTLYMLGFVVAAWPLARGWLRVRSLVAGARPPRDREMVRLMDESRRRLGVRRQVALLVHAEASVPMACGIARPAVLLPAAFEAWDGAALRAVLLHELAHVAAADVAFGAAARLACALFWWHPAVWWLTRELRADCELACDDRVLSAGVRASAYAELLVRASDHLAAAGAGAGRPAAFTPAFALACRGSLRGRLAAIVDTRRDVRAPGAVAIALTILLTTGVALPASLVELAPTRGVLTRLMTDSRWDARAWAVLGLAQRADSIAVARAAAAADPSPRVRAWARLALGVRDGLPARVTTTPER